MDFHTLPRRDLQFLCKKNKIPANMTNVAMADALEALQTVEGIDEILNDASKLESPKKAEAGSPELPRTASRRASARRAPAAEEPKGTQGSPLPRSRRVTAKALEILQLVDGDGVEDEGKQEGKKEMPKTPAAALRSSRKPQGTAGRRAAKKGESGAEEIVGETLAAASGARTMRRRTSKKEEQEGVHEAAVEVPLPTPATRGGRRTAARKATAAEEDEKEEEAAAASRTTARRTRQTARKATESAAASTAGRRVTRAMAAAKMAELDQEEEEDNDRVTEGIDGPKNGSPQASDEKSDSLKNMEVSDSKGDLVEKMDGCEGVENECNEEVGEQKRDPFSGLEDSPIRGLVSEVDPLSLCDEIVEKSQESSITDLIPVDVDSHPTEERNGGDAPDGKEEGGSGEALSGALNDDLILLDSSKQLEEIIRMEKKKKKKAEKANPAEKKVLEDTEGLLEISSISGEVLPKTAAELSVAMDDTSSAADPTRSPAKEEGMPEELINSSVKSSPLVGDPTGEIINSVTASLTNISIDTGDLVENTSDSGLVFEAPEAHPLDSSDCSSVETTIGITSPVEEVVEEKSAGKVRVSLAIYEEKTNATENKVADSLAMAGAESGEVEGQFKVADQNLLPKAVDLHSLSLRKLRTIYKEKLINVNNNTKVMEGKRLALAELNENLLS
uniref:Uncharacterized protein n=1 Tax=Ananas comosus var. bracteatus TaxID=296719 RepID=A0A6V7QQP3_ANACO|nr:unnamed protein product [Ananas comosus var. bracteatus]